MAKVYTTSDPITFDGSDLTYSHVCDAGVAKFTIPEHATMRPGRDGDCWNWTEKVAGGSINVQAYGPDAKPGATATFEVEVREKMMSPKKGGYKFLFLKLKPTDAEIDSQVVVANGGYLRTVEDLDNEAISTVWCPQQKHEGGVVFAPISVTLPAQRPTSHQVQRKKASA